jgi:hypothetical protein
MSSKIKKVRAGCPLCGGSGHQDGDTNKPFCPAESGGCSGGGAISLPETATQNCPRCSGTGSFNELPCKPCAATGRVATDALAVATAEAEAQRKEEEADAETKAQLDAAREEGRQAAFRETGVTDVSALKDQLAQCEENLRKNDKEIKKLRKQLAAAKIEEDHDPAPQTAGATAADAGTNH